METRSESADQLFRVQQLIAQIALAQAALLAADVEQLEEHCRLQELVCHELEIAIPNRAKASFIRDLLDEQAGTKARLTSTLAIYKVVLRKSLRSNQILMRALDVGTFSNQHVAPRLSATV